MSSKGPYRVTPPNLLHDYEDGKNMRTPKSIGEFFKGNQRWREGVKHKDPAAFETLSRAHRPKFMWIGCCDARVPVDRLVDIPQGEVFVARNVANIVNDTDVNVQAAIQYAVEVLLVEHIIVCGHYDCGGIRAAIENKDHGAPLENWLCKIRDIHRLHELELLRITDTEAKHRRLVELNVGEQCLNVFKSGVVQRRHALTSKWSNGFTVPRIHACVYDVSDGVLRELALNFEKDLLRYSNIYQIYFMDEKGNNEADIEELDDGDSAQKPPRSLL